jgi:hypothetical protein
MQEITMTFGKNRARLNEKEVIETIGRNIRLVDAGIKSSGKEPTCKWSTNDRIARKP